MKKPPTDLDKAVEIDEEVDDKTPTKPRQKRAKEIEMTKNKLLQECINVMKSPTTTSLPVLASGEQTFGRFVAEKLLSFDKYTKLVAEKRITDTLRT